MASGPTGMPFYGCKQLIICWFFAGMGRGQAGFQNQEIVIRKESPANVFVVNPPLFKQWTGFYSKLEFHADSSITNYTAI